jgi:hypothetical protein
MAVTVFRLMLSAQWRTAQTLREFSAMKLEEHAKMTTA